MKIGVIGTGYVGLVSGVCFASAGNTVTCVDARPDIVHRLNNGEVTIYEPGLESLLQQSIAEKNIAFTQDIAGTIQNNDMLFIAVGTPMNQDRSADLSAIRAVAESIGKHANGEKIVTTKSTVPVGTGDMIEEMINLNTKHVIDVVSNPEFLKEGTAVQDFRKPDRVVIGFNPSERSQFVEDTFTELYRPFTMNNGIMFMSRVSAELTKYTGNAMLAARISLMNEVARIADKVGANIDDVRRGIGKDTRIGPAFLYAGPSYGGSCFPKDVEALRTTGHEHGVAMPLVQAVSDTNELQRIWFVNKILAAYDGNVRGKVFGLWGLAFKGNTDDVRLSPAMYAAEKLTNKGARIIAYDPKAHESAHKVLGDRIGYAATQYDCFPADALLIMTDWNVFKSPDFSRMQLRDNRIIDGRNLYDLSSMKKQPFQYISVGRPTVH